jgi:hypothetical protein
VKEGQYRRADKQVPPAGKHLGTTREQEFLRIGFNPEIKRAKDQLKALVMPCCN